MKKNVLIFVWMFCINIPFIYSQKDTNTSTHRTKIGGYSLGFGGGYAGFQSGGLDNLNLHLQDKMYALVPEQLPTWNLDLVHAIIKNNVINFSVNGFFKKNSVNDSSKTTFNGTLINIGLGRVIVHTKKMLVYPLVTVDFGSLKLHSHFSGQHTAADISGTNTYRTIDASFNMDYIFKGFGNKIDWKSNTPKFPFSGVMTLSIGYVYCPANTYWTDSNFDGTVKNTQNVNYPVNVIGALTYSNFSMLYVSLKLGLGAFVHK